MDRGSVEELPRSRKRSETADAPSARRSAKRDAAPAGEDSRNLVNSLSKGLRVLEAFTAERSELTLSEVARAARIDPGTAFRMLKTLVLLGYVARVPDSRRFRLTLKVVDLGLHAIGRADLRELARPILRSLVGEVSEAASFGVLDGADLLYVERVRAGLIRLGVDIRIGTHIPAVSGVIGHAILAFLPPAERDRIIAMPSRPGDMTAKPISTPALLRTLEAVRKRGYALQDSMFGNGLRILAAPVLDPDGCPVAAISVAAPAVRISLDEFRARALGPVQAAAADIARAVQASGTVTTAV
ncbi:MAG: IclR family transcriptional regulator [Alphaproteobacteria bacterium]|nr:IclR family transcriptional regulator [Alphaproteobacteria bacterium]